MSILDKLFKKRKKEKEYELEIEPSIFNKVNALEIAIDESKLSEEQRELLNKILLELEDLKEKVYEIYYIIKKERELKKLTQKELEILKLLLEHDEMTAEDVAVLLNISRSTASLRLNKLYAMGYLGKTSRDKKVYYYIKDKKYVENLIKEYYNQ